MEFKFKSIFITVIIPTPLFAAPTYPLFLKLCFRNIIAPRQKKNEIAYLYESKLYFELNVDHAYHQLIVRHKLTFIIKNYTSINMKHKIVKG